jgi:hypothetical protein
MPEGQPNHESEAIGSAPPPAAAEPAPTPVRPDPPAYNPNEDLIDYIQRLGGRPSTHREAKVEGKLQPPPRH